MKLAKHFGANRNSSMLCLICSSVHKLWYWWEPPLKLLKFWQPPLREFLTASLTGRVQIVPVHLRVPYYAYIAGYLKKKNSMNQSKKLFIIFLSYILFYTNTPGTAGGPGSRDRTLAIQLKIARKSFFSSKKIKINKKSIFFLHISSSYAKILGETNVHTR